MNAEDLILPVNYIPSIDEFLESLRIGPKGLGAQLLKEVYKQFFVWSVDLREEYQKYYCVEYSSLSIYLELAHDICLNPDKLEKKYLLKLRSLSGVVDRAYDGNSLDAVISCRSGGHA